MSNNLLQFTIKLQDYLTAPLRRITAMSGGVASGLAKIDDEAKKLKGMLRQTGGSIDYLNQKIERLTARRNLLPAGATQEIRTINSELKKLNGEVTRLSTINGSKIKSLAGDAFSNIPGAALMRNPLVMAGAAVGAAGKLGVRGEQNKMAYTTLLGSEEKANTILGEIGGFAKRTPFRKQEIVEAGLNLMGFGVDTKRLIPVMQQFGDLSMGNSAKFGSMVDNYGKMVSAQRANTMDLNQFAIAGIPIWSELEKIVGLNGTELRKYVEKNGISIAQVDQAMSNLTGSGGRFFNMLSNQSQTAQGKWSNLLDTIEQFAENMGEVLIPIIGPVFEGLTYMVGKLAEGMGALVKWTKENSRWLLTLAAIMATGYAVMKLYNAWQIVTYMWMMRSSIAQALTAKWTAINTVLTTTWSTALGVLRMAFLSTPIGWLVVGLGALVGWLTYASLATKKLAADQKALGEARDEAGAEAEKEKLRLQQLQKVATDANKPLAERKKALNELRKTMADFATDLRTEKDLQEKGSAAIEAYTANLFQQSLVRALEKKLDAQMEKVVDARMGKGSEPGVMAGVITGLSSIGFGGMNYGEFGQKMVNKQKRLKQANVNEEEGVYNSIAAMLESEKQKLTNTIKTVTPNSPTDLGSGKGSKGLTESITGGGPRVININGVKFADNINIHGGGGRTAMENTEDQLSELFLRVLNSGAAAAG